VEEVFKARERLGHAGSAPIKTLSGRIINAPPSPSPQESPRADDEVGVILFWVWGGGLVCSTE
jgi:hypothetical protein